MYSLQDIENGVLRANRKGMGKYDSAFEKLQRFSAGYMLVMMQSNLCYETLHEFYSDYTSERVGVTFQLLTDFLIG